ncbi:MAG: SHOCT domain-containing protein [Comamonadaceae bacterium]|nr:MAG: SHOCT domain-containing protein [Comamonadaceae bacterium]
MTRGKDGRGQCRCSADDVLATLKKLGELCDAGVVTPEEFESKKAELLARP